MSKENINNKISTIIISLEELGLNMILIIKMF